AWRYGDQFGRRRRRALWLAGGATVAMGAVVIGASAAGIGIGGFGGLWGNLPAWLRMLRVVKLKTAAGELLPVRGTQFSAVSLSQDSEGPLLGLRAGHAVRFFRGEEALKLAGQLLPAINYAGGTKATVSLAVRSIEAHSSSAGYLAAAIPRGFG